MRRLERAYGDRLTVLGIHSPKFPAERETPALRAALARLGVGHPVANDRDFRIWREYAVRAWPTLVFIDPAGRVIGRHEGEFDYAAMASAVEAMWRPLPPGATLPGGSAPSGGPPPSPDGLRFPGKAVGTPDGYAVSDTGHDRVVLLDRQGRAVAVFGGGGAGLADGPAAQATFNAPQGLAWSDGTLLVADTGNHALRAIDVASGHVRTLAGDGAQGALWSSPWDVAVLGERVFVAMAGVHRIALWTPADPRGRPFSGSGREGLADGAPATAQYAQPSGLCADGRALYVADSETSAVRRLDPDSGEVRTLVGQGLFEFGDRDGTGGDVRLQHCLGVAAHGGCVYLADSYNHRVKRLDPTTLRVSSVAGTGNPGSGDGPGPEAAFHEPGGIAAAHGALVVADTNNHALRLVDPQRGTVTSLAVTGLGRFPAPGA